eukprot:2228075-Prymnesium_polylepis.1
MYFGKDRPQSEGRRHAHPGIKSPPVRGWADESATFSRDQSPLGLAHSGSAMLCRDRMSRVSLRAREYFRSCLHVAVRPDMDHASWCTAGARDDCRSSSHTARTGTRVHAGKSISFVRCDAQWHSLARGS